MMYNTDDKINKMLGKQQPPRMGYGYGPGARNMAMREFDNFPKSPETLGFNKNIKMNPNEIVQYLKQVLDKFPEVKKAHGNLNVEFEDGNKTVVKLAYNEKGGF